MARYFRSTSHITSTWLTVVFALYSGIHLHAASPLAQPEEMLPQLAEIINSARQNAPSLVEQDYFRQEADQRLQQAKSSYYPSVDLNANLGYRKDYRDQGAEDTSKFGLSYSARLTRPLYHWGAIEARIEQAKVDNDIEALQYLQNTQQIYRAIRSDYLTLLLNQASLKNEQLKKDLLKNDLERLKADFQTGNISELEYQTKELDLQNSLLLINSIGRDQKRIIARFKQNAGWNRELNFEAEIPSVDLESLEVWISDVNTMLNGVTMTNNIAGLITQYEIEKQAKELTIIQARQRPLFNFMASASQGQSNTSTQNNVDTFSLFGGINVSWNIFDGFRTKHQKIEAKLKHRRLEAKLNRLSDDLGLEQQSMVDRLQSQVEQTDVLEKRYKLQLRSFENSQTEAQAGRLSTSELTLAESRLSELKVTLLEARAMLLMQMSDYLDLIEPELKSLRGE